MRTPLVVSGLVAALLSLQSIAAHADDRGNVAAPPPAAGETEMRHHTAAPWIVVGAGAGVAALGVLSFVGAVKAHDDVASESAAKGCTVNATVTCPTGVDATNIRTNLDGEHAMNILGVILTAAGGAAIVTGLVWHFLEPTGPVARHAIVVTPALGPSYGGVGFAMTF
jgi:hypothetical protein